MRTAVGAIGLAFLTCWVIQAQANVNSTASSAAPEAQVEPPPQPVENRQTLSKPIPYSGQMNCAQVQLLQGAKDWVQKTYGNRSYSKKDCGGGVGDSILHSGIPFILGNDKTYNRGMAALGERTEERLAYKYMDYLPEFGFQRIDIKRPEDAPPGSVLVFSGGCARGPKKAIYRSPDAKPNDPCRTEGDQVGHVTIAGSWPGIDNKSIRYGGRGRYYYTDGRTSRPAIEHRYLIGVFIPGKKLDLACLNSNANVASSPAGSGRPIQGAMNAVR